MESRKEYLLSTNRGDDSDFGRCVPYFETSNDRKNRVSGIAQRGASSDNSSIWVSCTRFDTARFIIYVWYNVCNTP
ncbi:hypothetical protein KI387_000327 [Taxus chinensis]|uniref:Uncharacterized protein n=1 Tax=Taxus chinensis TaxID=29808 RepID=A0AA38LLL7_TAXCH|nr:hypothetical protein KI387_000327 [Taxus chinensis]